MNLNALGVLVIGHGTRDAVGQSQMRSLACQIAGCLTPVPTDLGFLELAEPTIAQAVQRLAANGVRRLITVPVLLFRAGHADRDIPDAVSQAAAPFGIDVLYQTPPLEYQAAVVQLSADRFHDAIAARQCQDVPSSQIALALIARGSSRLTAAQAMEEFARRQVALTGVREHCVGFVAVRTPTVEQSLDWLAQTSADLLVVQPHLLFEGEVFHTLRLATEQRALVDGRKWLVCQPLGAPPDRFDDDRLARVVASQVHAALSDDALGCIG